MLEAENDNFKQAHGTLQGDCNKVSDNYAVVEQSHAEPHNKPCTAYATSNSTRTVLALQRYNKLVRVRFCIVWPTSSALSNHISSYIIIQY